jgi:uncharacterized membrane protein YadS
MNILPSVRDVLWEAALGARGWFLAVFAIGCALVAFGLLTESTNMNSAYAYAFLMPFWLAALMGTVALWSYRTRQHWRLFSPAGRTVFVGAVLWNTALVGIASAAEQLLTRSSVLDRPPRDLTEALAGPVAIGCIMALFIAVPRER